MYRIKDNGGRYYNQDNDCMGPVQAATLYEKESDCPQTILNGSLERDYEVWCMTGNTEYYLDSNTNDATCWIEEVR